MSLFQKTCLATIVVILLAVDIAFAELSPPSGPAQSVSGTYDVTYPWDDADSGCDWVELQESDNTGGSWSYVLDSNYDGVVEFVDKPVGIYRYRAMEECEDYYGEDSWEEYSDEISIIVGPTPEIDSWTVQFEYEYDVRFDGVDSLLVQRTSDADEGNGAIDTIILEKQTDGTFASFVPTSSQISSALNWSLATSVEVQLFDLNIDGFVDITLNNLESILAGVDDQIVFAPAEIYSTSPIGIKAIDQELLGFSEDLLSYYQDADFFDDNMVLDETPGYWETTYECEWVYTPFEGWEIECDTIIEWIDGETIETFPGVNDKAVSVWQKIKDFLFGQGGSGAIKQVFGAIFGVPIGGGQWCIDFGVSTDPDTCIGVETNLMIAQLANSTKKSPGRALDTVYLTKHRIDFTPFDHTALEYSVELAGVKTTHIFSAEPTGPLTFGTLDKKYRKPSDILNVTVSTVTSFVYATPLLHFGALQIGFDHYKNDCIPYEGTPPYGAGEHNSNGFVAGLLSVTGSVIANGSMIDFTGGSNAVPNEYFTAETPCD